MTTKLLLLALFACTLWTASAQQLISEDDSGSSISITAQGSSTTQRSNVDGDPGQVYIYGGGNVPFGTHLVSFQFLFDHTDGGNTSGYITPLLFEKTSNDIFTVVGIGQGYEVYLHPTSQTIPFNIIEGIKVPLNDRYRFGYINAIVDSAGVPTMTSPGTVDYDQPFDIGHGVGGPGTDNIWAATALYSSPHVTLGTTFGATGADYPFYSQLRTYSAFMDGVVVP